MDKTLQSSLEQVRQLCNNGFVDKALYVLEGIVKVCPEYYEDILYEKAVIEFENGRIKDALLDFVNYYERTGSEDALSIIIAFASSNEQRYKERYYRNKDRLIDYPFFYGEIDNECYTRVLWYDEELIVFQDVKNGVFHINTIDTVEIEQRVEATLMLVEEFSGERLIKYMEAYKESWSVNGRKLPMYLFFKEPSLNAFLQCVELEQLLESKRLVFLVGMDSVESFFNNPGAALPAFIQGNDMYNTKETILNILVSINKKIGKECKELFDSIHKYYDDYNSKEILRRIKDKKPRVLIFTSKYTTALQYHAENCRKALDDMGIDTYLLMEEDVIFKMNDFTFMSAMNAFKPDILFQLDHFRFEGLNDLVPGCIVGVTWIQDPIDKTIDKTTQAKLTSKDVVMTHLFSEEVLGAYDERRIIAAPIPANENVYKPYELTDAERERYECDICMVCHTSGVEQYIGELIGVVYGFGLPDTPKVVMDLVYNYYDQLHEGIIIYSKSGFFEYVKSYLQEFEERWHDDQVYEFLAEEMYKWINQRLFRQVLADWIIEAGYENIKLWGSGWKTSIKYEKFAMGPAQNGEELAKICRASKIVLGNNIQTTAAARAWETMLSGGFYLSNYIPPEYDWCDIRKIIHEGKDFIMFHNKEELLNNIEFYLNHEDKRQEMIKRGREAALNKMTFKILMQKMLDELPEILEQQGAYAEIDDM